MFQGIDISHYQGTIHFDQVKSHVSWVWAKSSEGLGNDPMYLSYVAGMNANAIPHGSYHFYREASGVAQIDHWANVDRSKGIRPMLDVEVDPCTERMLDQCLARADQRFGTQVVLYTYDSFINEHPWMRKYHDLRPVNVAKYSQHQPSNNWHIWQNTDSLQIPGFTTQQPDGDVTNDIKWVLTTPPPQKGFLDMLNDSQQADLYNWCKDLHDTLIDNAGPAVEVNMSRQEYNAVDLTNQNVKALNDKVDQLIAKLDSNG